MEQKMEHICPLCGGPNECAMAETGDGSHCWCREATINLGAMVRAREATGNKSCICRRCAMTVTEPVKVRLYGTGPCHLCEEAGSIIRMTGGSAINIDIAEDGNLFEKYGMRIPVLQRIDNDAELDWPFDVVEVLRFLK